MHDRHPFVVLEGVSGVGKSTVAELLAAALGGAVLKTPPPPFDVVRAVVDPRILTVTGRYLFYLAGVVEASERIKSLLQQSAVVCDRYLLTTECYHRVLGLTLEIDYGSLALVQPDLTVVLTCAERLRRQRIDRRGWSFNDRAEEQRHLTRRFQEELLKYPVLAIDTTEQEPLGIVNQIIKALRLHPRKVGRASHGRDQRKLYRDGAKTSEEAIA